MVELRNEQRKTRLPALRLKQEAQRVLEALDLGDRTLSVLLTGDRRMAGLHERWMGEEGPTDVMSFPFTPAPLCPLPSSILGDVVISAETAARRRPRDVPAEVKRYLIHGILHLAGHDHRTLPQRKRMNRLARALMRRIS